MTPERQEKFISELYELLSTNQQLKLRLFHNQMNAVWLESDDATVQSCIEVVQTQILLKAARWIKQEIPLSSLAELASFEGKALNTRIVNVAAAMNNCQSSEIDKGVIYLFAHFTKNPLQAIYLMAVYAS